jgi:hypothetical protein
MAQLLLEILDNPWGKGRHSGNPDYRACYLLETIDKNRERDHGIPRVFE